MRVFTVLGPSGSGKTTLIQELSGLDGPGNGGSHDVGGVAVTKFRYLGEDWAAFEVPGGADTLAMAGPALALSDIAVLCVPAEADAAVLAAPYLRLIEEAGIPCDLFINRIDCATDRIRDIVGALQVYCQHHIVLRQIPMREGQQVVGAVDLISERAWEYREGAPSALVELPVDLRGREREARSELLESLADFDDNLLEQLIEDQAPRTSDVFGIATRILQDSDLISAFLGAAAHGNGVTRLMKSLRHEASGSEALLSRLGAPDGTLAVSGPADIRKHLGQVVVCRALSAPLTTGDTLGGDSVGALIGLDGRSAVKEVSVGEIALAAKSDHLAPAQILSADDSTDCPEWTIARPPMLRQMAHAARDRDDVRLSSALGRLAAADYGLCIDQDEATGAAILEVQGPLHLRTVTQRISDDFGIELTLDHVPPAYRETIKRRLEHRYRHRKQSGGAGQFADVVIEISPTARGSGFVFEESVKGGTVPRSYIPAVEAGARDALAAGAYGFPVIDVRVALLDGKHHAVDSSDYAFRAAARQAVKEALEIAGAVLLQPILKVDIHVPSIFAGGLVPTVTSHRGQVHGFEAHPTAAGWDVFSALVPAAEHDDLVRSLAGTTRGTAWLRGAFDHFEEAGAKELAVAQSTLLAASDAG